MTKATLGTVQFATGDSTGARESEQCYEASDLASKNSTARQKLLSELALSLPAASISWDMTDAIKENDPLSIEGISELAGWLGSAIKRYAPWTKVDISPSARELAKSVPAVLEALLELPLPIVPPIANRGFGWDSLVDPWVDSIPEYGNKIPSAYRIWLSSRRYLVAGETDRARRCEELNYILHNSYVSARLQLRGEITFAYGGIGVIIHPDADIYPGVTVGANVTIGSSGSRLRTDDRTGKPTTVPVIGEYTTIGACANISGGIELGAMSIVAPNSVVTKPVPAGQIVAGTPARPIGQVTIGNALRYKVKYLQARSLSDDEYMAVAVSHLPA